MEKVMDKFGYTYMVGFILILLLVFSGWIELADSLRDTANILVGVLAAGLMKLMDYKYGSSEGSKLKTEALVGARKDNG